MGYLGIIGGSGLYDMPGLKKVRPVRIKTPFGAPSDKFIIGELSGREIVFLPRHGAGHRIGPSELNYRANIYGMKKLGVDRIISVTACGSLKETLRPMDFVLPEQFVDRTNQARKMSFFENGLVAHISFAEPVCKELVGALYRAAKEAKVTVHLGGIYLNMEGPAFSTKAESNLYRAWGMDIIGMTNMAEAKLAREAEICYCSLAAVTDYDCWHVSHESVTTEMIIANLNKNIENSRNILKNLIFQVPAERSCPCKDALKSAIVTDRKFIPRKTKKDLNIIIGKYL